MSQTGLKPGINIITTPHSIIYKLVKYIQTGKITLFFRNWSLNLALMYFTSMTYISYNIRKISDKIVFLQQNSCERILWSPDKYWSCHLSN